MTIRSEDLKNIGKFKQSMKNTHKCPICNKKIEIGIEFDMIKKLGDKDKGIFSFLVIPVK